MLDPVSTHRDARADRLHRCLQHGAASQCVHIHKLHAGHRGRRKNRTCDRIRDVVEFQIQKDAGTQRGNFFHRRGPRGRKQLVADLEHTYEIADLFCKFCGGR